MKKIIWFVCIGLCIFPRLASGEILSVAKPQASASVQILDNQDKPLQTFLSTRETYAQPVPLTDISPFILLAVQTAEDRRFYQHKGVDVRAVLRAVWQNLRHRKIISGASTITQQLARALHSRPKSWYGKWAEAWKAIQLEKKYTKDEILEQYLNILEFGNHTQGIEAAAQFYFGLPASAVSVAQAALLAGLIQAPTRLNPLRNSEGALTRRNYILQRMYQQKLISKEQYELAYQEPLGIQAAVRPVQAPHFARLISRLVPQGSTVHTFLDSDLQSYAEQVVRAHIGKLTAQQVTNAAVVVLDNQTGGILAYVGSADFTDTKHAGQVDGVLAKRQPGSALKPFVYALALQQGVTAATLLADEDTFFEGGFRPRNYDKSFHGRVSLREALACSYNIPVIKVAETLGAQRILQLLQRVGFVSLNRPAEFYGLGVALGSGEVTLLELANAYRTLARGGVVSAVLFAQEPILQNHAPSQRVLPADISYIITDILADNAARAEAFGVNSALQFPFPAAAKTGTSKDYKDNFAIGYTPRLTIAVWAGNFDGTSMRKVSGVTGAAPILHDVFMYAQKRYPGGEFIKPEDVESAVICKHSGLLAGPTCKETREEIFTKNTLPKQICPGEHISTEETLRITFPVRGDIFSFDPALPAVGQQVHITTDGALPPCRWQLNDKILPHTGPDFWWALEVGHFELKATCGTQQTTTFFTVL